jgi:hypothetical protein
MSSFRLSLYVQTTNWTLSITANSAALALTLTYYLGTLRLTTHFLRRQRTHYCSFQPGDNASGPLISQLLDYNS